MPRAGAGRPDAPDVGAVRGIEHLHAVVARVGDGDPGAVGRPCRGPGPVQLPVEEAVRAQLAGEGAVGIEHLNAMVERVGDCDHSGHRHGRRRRRRERNGPRPVKLPGGNPGLPETAERRAVGAEEADAVIASVGDCDMPARRGVYCLIGPGNLPGARAVPKLVYKGAVGANDLDAVVVEVCHDHPIAVRGVRGRGRLPVLLRPVAIRSQRASICTVGVKDVCAMPAIMGNNNPVAGWRVRDGARAGQSAIVASPRFKLAGWRAVGIEQLDARITIVSNGQPVA